MGVRAYKVIEIKTEIVPTFNLWNDERIFFWLASYGHTESLNTDSCGIMEVSKEAIEEALADKDKDWNKEELTILKKMLADCGEEDYVLYNCY